MDVSKFGSEVTSEVETTAVTETENRSELLTEVASLTGLPVDWVQTELTQIVKDSGHTPEQLTLEELRASMLQYLEEMNKEMLAKEAEEAEASELAILDAMLAPGDISH